MPRRTRVEVAAQSSVEWYRDRIRSLVEEVERGPDFDAYNGDFHIATGVYKTRLELLNALSKAALADKGLEDLASIHRKLREAETTIAEMLRATADERHHRAARVSSGRAVGDGVPGTPLH